MGEKLARLRKARHLRQADAAAYAGLARSTVARIEKFNLSPTHAQILRYLADIAPGIKEPPIWWFFKYLCFSQLPLPD